MIPVGMKLYPGNENVLKSGDGYIFSKSVKMLPETEKTWVLLENDYKNVTNKKGEVLYRIKECVDDFSYSFTDEEGRKKVFKVTEKRVVTFNPSLAKKQRYEINILVDTITGHFFDLLSCSTINTASSI